MSFSVSGSQVVYCDMHICSIEWTFNVLNYVTYLPIRYFLSQGLYFITILPILPGITIYVPAANSIPIFDSPIGGIWVENLITDSSYINMMNANLWNMHGPKYENIRPVVFSVQLGCNKPMVCDDIDIWLISLNIIFFASFTTQKINEKLRIAVIRIFKIIMSLSECWYYLTVIKTTRIRFL